MCEELFMINNLTTSGPIPTLQAAMNFAGRRHQLLLNNISNISTPNYVQQDVSARDFQSQLAEAVAERRGRTGSAAGELHLKASREVRQDATGRLVLSPMTTSNNIMFHDRNNRDLESQMQALVENGMVFRMAGDFMKARFDLLRSAISERA